MTKSLNHRADGCDTKKYGEKSIEIEEVLKIIAQMAATQRHRLPLDQHERFLAELQHDHKDPQQDRHRGARQAVRVVHSAALRPVALHHGCGCLFVCTPSPALSCFSVCAPIPSSSIHQDPMQYFADNWMLEPINHSATWVANTAWT